jgi:caffeoyl-CoA O-methyltransferase
MAPRSFLLDQQLQQYLIDHSSPPDETQAALISETAALGAVSGMQIAPDQGALLTLLAGLVGARHAVEVGTFTGYSSIAIARGLADGGKLHCFDVSDEWTSIARRFWDRAGVADRIVLHLGPAAENLEVLPDEAHLDLVFIDADKPGYITYYEALVPRLRPGGILLADNVLWSGKVVDASDTSEGTNAIRSFNDHVTEDPRVESVILPVGDGLTLAVRRPA